MVIISLLFVIVLIFIYEPPNNVVLPIFDLYIYGIIWYFVCIFVLASLAHYIPEIPQVLSNEHTAAIHFH